MKVLFANKFFYPKGGSETVFFQERDFLINNGHKVIDFSMEHLENIPSECSEYFVPNVDYQDGSKCGRLASLTGKFNIAFDLVHNSDVVKRLRAWLKNKNRISVGIIHKSLMQRDKLLGDCKPV